MSTNAQVRTVWQAQVFDNLTPTAYDYYFDYDSSETSPDKGMTAGDINHFQYLVSSTEEPLVSKRNNLIFTVKVRRIIEDEPTGANHNALIDDFRTLLDYVNDNLDTDWDGTVELSTDYPEATTPELSQWGSVPVWIGEITFKAVKEIAA